jgi:hypothetical protein
MMRSFWVDGRLSWPLVISVAFLTLSAVIIDFVWRSFVVPFETLLIYSVICEGVAIILLLGARFQFRDAARARRSPATPK